MIYVLKKKDKKFNEMKIFLPSQNYNNNLHEKGKPLSTNRAILQWLKSICFYFSYKILINSEQLAYRRNCRFKGTIVCGTIIL